MLSRPLFRCRIPFRASPLLIFNKRCISDDMAHQLKQRLQDQKSDLARDYTKQMIDQKMEEDTQLKLKYRTGTDIIHNEEFEGTIYKYDLPLENKPILFRNSLMVIDGEEDQSTPVMNLYEELDLDMDSSYEQYVIKVNQNYNHEIDMYGDIKKAGSASLKVLQFGVPIPHDLIEDKLTMSDIRLHATFNQDMPGAIENVHPNKFIANLRPVEEFRHTPVIPVPEKDLKELQKKIEARNRKGYFIEIKKETIYYYVISALIFGVIAYSLYIANENAMGTTFQLDKHRIGRYEHAKGSEGLERVADGVREFKMPGQ